MDVLRFNDNGSNEFSDAHYAAGLVRALADVRRFNRNDIGYPWMAGWGGWDAGDLG